MKFTFCFKSTSNNSNTDQSNPESGSTTEEQPVFTLYGSGEAYDGDYYESDYADATPGLAAEKKDESYFLCYPGTYTSNGWDLLKSLDSGVYFEPVFGTTRISPRPTGPDTSETYWDYTMAGNPDKKPQVKIMDGIEFVVICPSTGMFPDILPKIKGFYKWNDGGSFWMNQRGTASIRPLGDKFYFTIDGVNVLESVGSPSSPVCQYQTMDGTKIESGAMQVKFAYEAFAG